MLVVRGKTPENEVTVKNNAESKRLGNNVNHKMKYVQRKKKL